MFSHSIWFQPKFFPPVFEAKDETPTSNICNLSSMTWNLRSCGWRWYHLCGHESRISCRDLGLFLVSHFTEMNTYSYMYVYMYIYVYMSCIYIYVHPWHLTCPLKRDHFKKEGSSFNHHFWGSMWVGVSKDLWYGLLNGISTTFAPQYTARVGLFLFFFGASWTEVTSPNLEVDQSAMEILRDCVLGPANVVISGKMVA